jgi:hypothetical protein
LLQATKYHQGVYLPLPAVPQKQLPRAEKPKAKNKPTNFFQGFLPAPSSSSNAQASTLEAHSTNPARGASAANSGVQHGSEDSGVQWKKSKVEEKGKGKRKEVSEIEESGEEKLKEPVDFKDAD